jgi:hypothetical protein
MEEIDLTPGQMQVLLNATAPGVAVRDRQLKSLVVALHKVHRRDYSWVTEMSTEAVELALDIFKTHQMNYKTPAARKYLQTFVQGSTTAQQIYAERKQAREAQGG